MARVKSGVANALIEVDDITNIIDLCEGLDIGDLVAENKNGVKKLYRVSTRGVSELALSYVDNEQSSVVAYERDENGVWSYDETKETELGGGGGTKLYKHTITVTPSGTPAISTIIVINNSNNEINTALQLALGNFISGCVTGASSGILIDGGFYGYNAINFIDTSDASKKTASVTFVSDTITEL